MKFTKMHGCGNDYIYVNGFAEKIDSAEKPNLVRRLSHRKHGIGGDGVIFINPSEIADFEMEMYNADGTRAEMCGNGIRCVGKFVYDKGLTDAQHITVESGGAVKELELLVDGSLQLSGDRGEVKTVRVNMGRPILEPSAIPVQAKENPVVNVPILVDGVEYHMTCVSMGNPHAVIFAESVRAINLEKIGPLFENHIRFPKRVNTEFVEVLNREHCFLRVWERGTGETLACGTGACAAVTACVLNDLTGACVMVKMLGGELLIEWDRGKDVIYMTGPAVTVFEGEV